MNSMNALVRHARISMSSRRGPLVQNGWRAPTDTASATITGRLMGAAPRFAGAFQVHGALADYRADQDGAKRRLLLLKLLVVAAAHVAAVVVGMRIGILP